MSIKQVNFKSKDIGGELLPIITKGLYLDQLDSIREYIQNSIDANSTIIKITILSSSLIIEDDGDGMSTEQAEKAMRLGLSDKKPDKNVGFRGVGIFSSYDICGDLEIITTSKATNETSNIYFHWDEIKGKLILEHEQRLKGSPSRLSLEELLSVSIGVTPLQSNNIPPHGTKVILTNIDQGFMANVRNIKKTTEYLQNTIPIPFSPEFSYGEMIQAWLTEESIKTVRLILIYGGQEIEVFRPYKDSMFTDHRVEAPKKIKVYDKHFKKEHGFAWVCYNGSNEYIPEVSIRGLILKKAGFSVGGRKYLEPLYTRVALARRATGEVILTKSKLLPNAARNEFEPGTERDSLKNALVSLVAEISNLGSKIDTKYRIIKWIMNAGNSLHIINHEISQGKTSQNQILNMEMRLNTILKDIKKNKTSATEYKEEEFNKIDALSKEISKSITLLLSKGKQDTVDNIQRAIKAAKDRDKTSTTYTEREPQTLTSLLQTIEVNEPESFFEIFKTFDYILQSTVSKSDYKLIIAEFTNHIDQFSHEL